MAAFVVRNQGALISENYHWGTEGIVFVHCICGGLASILDSEFGQSPATAYHSFIAFSESPWAPYVFQRVAVLFCGDAYFRPDEGPDGFSRDAT